MAKNKQNEQQRGPGLLIARAHQVPADALEMNELRNPLGASRITRQLTAIPLSLVKNLLMTLPPPFGPSARNANIPLMHNI